MNRDRAHFLPIAIRTADVEHWLDLTSSQSSRFRLISLLRVVIDSRIVANCWPSCRVLTRGEVRQDDGRVADE